MVAPVHRSEISFYSRYDLPSAISLSPSRRTKPQRQDGLTGGTGFNMNYSIILTEISFYPESSILLQIVGIIHMTNQIKPITDRYRRASACSGSGTTIIRLPQIKTFTCLSQGGKEGPCTSIAWPLLVPGPVLQPGTRAPNTMQGMAFPPIPSMPMVFSGEPLQSSAMPPTVNAPWLCQTMPYLVHLWPLQLGQCICLITCLGPRRSSPHASRM